MEKIIIGKEVKALLPVINIQDMRPHLRGVLINGSFILATDSKILVRMKLNTELPKEDIPANIKTGADADKVWVSVDTLKRALCNVPKKGPIPAVQQNVFVSKENGLLRLQVLDENLNAVSFEDRANSDELANDFPDTDKILNPEEKDAASQTVRISGETIIKLAEMVKSLGKDVRLVLEITDYQRPVFFRVEDGNALKADGAFMLLKNEG